MNRLLLLISLCFSLWGRASHIVGGDIYYDYLGNNQYRFVVAGWKLCAFEKPEYQLQVAEELVAKVEV